MTKCQACGGRAQTFLCGKCTKALRDNLAEMPWWIERLIESAVGQVRLGDGGKRSMRAMHGDDELASHIETLPGCECDSNWPPPQTVEHGFIGPLLDGWSRAPVGSGPKCTCSQEIARGKRHKAALSRMLALGRVNASASELHDDTVNVLTTWIRHLCETRGIQLVDPRFIGPLRPNEVRGPGRNAVGYARWLHKYVTAIANDETAGECFDELADIRKRIERTVNRPQSRKFLGKCPAWIEDTRSVCGRELYAGAEAIQVRCRDCHTTHNCNRLQLLLAGDQMREKVTMARVREINRNLPREYRIPERTMRRWIAEGRLKPRGYQRPDGSRGIARHSDADEPLYLWADLRKLRPEGSRGSVAIQ